MDIYLGDHKYQQSQNMRYIQVTKYEYGVRLPYAPFMWPS